MSGEEALAALLQDPDVASLLQDPEVARRLANLMREGELSDADVDLQAEEGAPSGNRAPIEDVPEDLTPEQMWEVVLQHILRAEIKGFRQVPNEPSGSFNITHDGVTLNTIIRIQRNTLCCKVPVPCMVPVQRREEAAKLLTLINFGLIVGGFQMDMSDGETFFMFSNTAEGSLSEHIVGTCVRNIVATAGKYIPSILRVIYNPNITAAESYGILG